MNPGSGATVATDDVAGKHYQRVKLTDGTADSENHAKVTAGGSLQVIDAGVSTAGQCFALSLGTTPVAPVAVQTGGANLAGRVFLQIQNNSDVNFEYNFAASWTLGAGQLVRAGQDAGLTLGPGLTLYIRAVSGSAKDCRVMELA
jgi:hypothetical protein